MEAWWRLLAALPAAAIAGLIVGTTGMLVLQWLPLPPWLGEAAATCLAAMAWLWIGRRVAGRHPVVSLILFLAGLCAAWFATRGFVRGISPYHGLLPIVAASIGGMAIWSGGKASGRQQVIGTAVPALAAFLLARNALRAPLLGERMEATIDGQRTQGQVVVDGATVWLWEEGTRPEGRSVRIDLEGSGLTTHALRRAPAVSAGRLCGLLRDAGERRVEQEIAEGAIPRFVTALPTRRVACERDGTLWQVSAGETW